MRKRTEKRSTGGESALAPVSQTARQSDTLIELLALIRAQEARIDEQGKTINRPYALGASLLLLPALVYLLMFYHSHFLTTWFLNLTDDPEQQKTTLKIPLERLLTVFHELTHEMKVDQCLSQGKELMTSLLKEQIKSASKALSETLKGDSSKNALTLNYEQLAPLIPKTPPEHWLFDVNPLVKKLLETRGQGIKIEKKVLVKMLEEECRSWVKVLSVNVGEIIHCMEYRDSNKLNGVRNAFLMIYHQLVKDEAETTRLLRSKGLEWYGAITLEAVTKLPTSDIHQLLVQHLQAVSSVAATIQVTTMMNAVVQALHAFWQLTQFTAIFVGSAGQWLLLDRFFSRAFPQGVLQKRLSHQGPQTIAAAKAYSKQLDQHEQQRHRIAFTHSLVHYAILILTTLVGLAQLASGGALSSEAWIVICILLSTAALKFFQLLSHWKNTKKLQIYLNRQQNFLKALFADCKTKVIVKPFSDRSVASSYFEIQFIETENRSSKRESSEKETLSAKKLAALAKDCFLQQHFPVISFDHRSFFIAAQFSSKKDKRILFLKQFQALQFRELDVLKLQQQIKKLLCFFIEKNGFSSLDAYVSRVMDAQCLPVLDIEWSCSLVASQKQMVYEQFKILFSEAIASPCLEENKILLRQARPIQDFDHQFSVLQKSVEALSRLQPWEGLATHAVDEDDGLKHKGSTTTPSPSLCRSKAGLFASNKKEEKPVATLQPAPSRVVRWKSFTFDSRSKENHVYPLHSSGIHDQNSMWRVRRFLATTLRPELLQAVPGLQEASDALFARAQLVSDHGKQGFKPILSHQRDQDNQWFLATLEGKFKGAHGDIRLYARSETSPDDGSTLFTVCGIDYKSH